MTIRESLERWEKEYLSPYAAYSMDSKGRLKEEEPCDIRPKYRLLLQNLSFQAAQVYTCAFQPMSS